MGRGGGRGGGGGCGADAGAGRRGRQPLGQVAGPGDERLPLGLDLAEAAQDALAEAAGVLEAADHRLNGLLALR